MLGLLLFLVIFNTLLILFAAKTKIVLYTIPPELEWSEAIDEFNKNKKAIDKLDISDYKLGSGHIYE